MPFDLTEIIRSSSSGFKKGIDASSSDDKETLITLTQETGEDSIAQAVKETKQDEYENTGMSVEKAVTKAITESQQLSGEVGVPAGAPIVSIEDKELDTILSSLLDTTTNTHDTFIEQLEQTIENEGNADTSTSSTSGGVTVTEVVDTSSSGGGSSSPAITITSRIDYSTNTDLNALYPSTYTKRYFVRYSDGTWEYTDTDPGNLGDPK